MSPPTLKRGKVSKKSEEANYSDDDTDSQWSIRSDEIEEFKELLIENGIEIFENDEDKVHLTKEEFKLKVDAWFQNNRANSFGRIGIQISIISKFKKLLK